MKAAAAVLGASLLFFLGVLTGAGRQESVPPPLAIPLGVADSTTSADRSTSPSPSSPSAPGGAAATPTTTRSSTPPASSPPAAPTGAPQPPTGTPAAAPVTTTPADGTATSTTVRPGQVEEVDNQVDCTPADKKGKGRREPCPSTTTATTEPGGGRGGGQNR